MRKNDPKQEESQMSIRLPKDVHMEAKAQAAYRNQTLQEYVADALMEQIESDKNYLKT